MAPKKRTAKTLFRRILDVVEGAPAEAATAVKKTATKAKKAVKKKTAATKKPAKKRRKAKA
jgi:hypothetical protein